MVAPNETHDGRTDSSGPCFVKRQCCFSKYFACTRMKLPELSWCKRQLRKISI